MQTCIDTSIIDLENIWWDQFAIDSWKEWIESESILNEQCEKCFFFGPYEATFTSFRAQFRLDVITSGLTPFRFTLSFNTRPKSVTSGQMTLLLVKWRHFRSNDVTSGQIAARLVLGHLEWHHCRPNFRSNIAPPGTINVGGPLAILPVVQKNANFFPPTVVCATIGSRSPALSSHGFHIYLIITYDNG